MSSKLTERWFKINKKARNHPVQKKLEIDFLEQRYRNFIIAAGRRSFKTERFAKRLLINLCLDDDNAGKLYFAVAPTRQQSKEIFWEDIKKLTPRKYIKKTREVDLRITFDNGSSIKVIGLKEFKRVQGQLMHGIVISEYQDCDPGVYNESIEPM